jgi:hypothetical protein
MKKSTFYVGVFKRLAPHILVVVVFIALALIYFKPTLEGKALQQSDMSQWRGAVQEITESAKNTPASKIAWSNSMFSGMPSYHFGTPGYPPNYLSYFQQGVSLGDFNGKGSLFAGLLFAYFFFFLLTRNVWLSLLGAIACAFSSYNIIILQAGHITKAWAIAYFPLVLSGLLLVSRKKFLMGGSVFAIGLSLELMAGHIQITYYLALFCLILFAGYVVNGIIKKEIKTVVKASLTLLVGLVFAVLPGVGGLYADYEMGKESLRGPSELTSIDSGETKPVSTGLDIDYAFAWSYGKSETLSLMIPDIKGGVSGGILDTDSHLYKALKQNGQRPEKKLQTYTYWGNQPFTSGPVYFGAIICFLFVLGMFVIKDKTKWVLLGGALFFIFLSWGNNMSWLNDFLFYHLPMYNKFRAPSMALVIPAIIFPLVAVWGLKQILNREIEAKSLKKNTLYALGITGGICLCLGLFPGVFFDFESVNDTKLISQVPEWYYNALLIDRASLLKTDAFRSLIFILLAGICVYFFMNKNKRQFNYSLIILALLVLIDLWMVDKRYLNDAQFEKKKSEKIFEPTMADNFILEDQSPSYRVLNLSTNTFNETATSYFHKSIGGYHAAKLRRYQELIDHRISKEMQTIVQSFQGATTLEDIYPVFLNTPTINMLNGKYIIYSPTQAPIINPNAGGNAWFIQEVVFAENANQELDALNTIDPRKTAVVDTKFAEQVKKQSFVPDSTASIELLEYQPAYLKYSSKTHSEQLAVFSEIYFKNDWKASIDGKQVDHFRADWVLRAMNVPAGDHTIEFRFEPDMYNTLSDFGSIASLLLIIGFIGILVYSGIKRKKESSEQ